MADWGSVLVAVVLFVLLTPGLLIKIPGRGGLVEFSSFQTSGASILVHALIFFFLITIFLLAIFGASGPGITLLIGLLALGTSEASRMLVGVVMAAPISYLDNSTKDFIPIYNLISNLE